MKLIIINPSTSRCSTEMIVDILDRDDSRHIHGVRFGRFAERITTRSEPAEPATCIDQADVQIAEPHYMVAGFEFGDADELAHQRFADEDPLASPHDLTRAAHPADLMIRVIPGIFHPYWHRSRRSSIELCRRSLPQRFMRPLLVVMPPERIEAPLLCSRIRCRRPRGLLLERAMHAFVPAILLRRGRMDEVRLYAELEPPCRQAGQTARSARAEWRSVIAADRKRQPITPKSRRKCRLRACDRGGHDPNVDQKSTVAVGQRQWIDAPMVCRAKPALEIRVPFV